MRVLTTRMRTPISSTIDENGYRNYRDCHRPPYLFKGRSYMYGLPDGVIPQAPLPIGRALHLDSMPELCFGA